MVKFSSFWGDIDAKEESITPIKEEINTEDPKEEPKKEDLEDDPKPAEDPKPTDTDEEEEEEGEGAGGDSTEDSKKEEEDEEFIASEDDVIKSYTMLLNEGVLEEDEDDDFEASPAGLADKVAATVRKRLDDEIAAIPPVVQSFYAHVMEGNDPGSFKAPVKIVWDEFDTSTEEAQEQALRTLYRGQKMSETDIDEEIEDIKAADKLAKKADIAVNTLAAQQTEFEKAEKIRNAKAAEEAEKTRSKEISEIEKTIDDAEEMAGFKLTDKVKTNFKQYLFKANPRTGKTKMQENMADEERRMRIAFLDFMDYNKEDMAKGIKTELTKTRRKKLTRFSDTNVKNRNSSASIKTKTDAKQGNIVYPSIFGSQTIDVED